LRLALSLQYLACFLVSPEITSEGTIAPDEFHIRQRGRYLIAFGLLNAISIPLNLVTANLFGIAIWG
jgi:hypothetical protein